MLCELLDIGSAPAASDERVVIIADAGEGAHFGIVVDELCGHQQVVVKSIEESYGSVPGIAGATILGNGRVAFILDFEKLVRSREQRKMFRPALSRFSNAGDRSRRELIVECNDASR